MSFRIKRVVCANGGIGRWFIYQKTTIAFGFWASFGKPIFWAPQLIHNQMNKIEGIETSFDVGVGWLFFCFRFTIQKEKK